MVKNKNFYLFIPSSILEDCSDILSKTIKIGFIARAAAIFRVNNIVIYSGGEHSSGKNAIFLHTILDYIDCPQYLRKILFPLKEELKYVGLLPPLEAPHHKRAVDLSKLKNGSIRQGAVIRKDKKNSYIDIGLEKPVLVSNTNLPFKRRLNIKIKKSGLNLLGKVVSDPEEYWGYRIIKSNDDLINTIIKIKPDLVIGASKYGDGINILNKKISDELKAKSSLGIVFGSPYSGIYDIIKNKAQLDDIFDYIINFIPEQGTRTIRSEEAIFAVLSIINLLIF